MGEQFHPIILFVIWITYPGPKLAVPFIRGYSLTVYGK